MASSQRHTIPHGHHSQGPPSSITWWRGVPGEEHVVKLNPASFEHQIEHSGRTAFVMFYAQWCGYSINARNAFASLAEQMSKEGNPIMIAAVDADESKMLVSRFREVNGYPSFLLFSKGSPKLTYQQARTREAFRDFILRNMAH